MSSSNLPPIQTSTSTSSVPITHSSSTSNLATWSASHATPLFEILNLPSKLILDNVYLNGLHALRRFEIRNISPYPLCIKLRSNLGSQIAFQLTNENLPDVDNTSRKIHHRYQRRDEGMVNDTFSKKEQQQQQQQRLSTTTLEPKSKDKPLSTLNDDSTSNAKSDKITTREFRTASSSLYRSRSDSQGKRTSSSIIAPSSTPTSTTTTTTTVATGTFTTGTTGAEAGVSLNSSLSSRSGRFENDLRLTKQSIPTPSRRTSAGSSASSIYQPIPTRSFPSTSAVNGSLTTATSFSSVSSPYTSTESLTSTAASGTSPIDSSPAGSAPNTPPPGLITTNTVQAAALGVFGTSNGNIERDNIVHGHQFNQLFNYVNHIDEIFLHVGETKKVIIAFLPDIKTDSRRVGNGNHMTRTSESSSITPNTGGTGSHSGGGGGGGSESREDDEETHEFHEVNGLLFFFAYRMDKSTETQESESMMDLNTNDTNVIIPDHEGKLNDSLRTKSLSEGSLDESPLLSRRYWSGTRSPISSTEEGTSSPPSFLPPPSTAISAIPSSSLSAVATPSNTIAANTTSSVPASSSNLPDYQATVKLRSRVCKSVLWTDVAETGIILDDCVVGGTYFKDFTVWNRSEIELYWLLNAVDLGGNDGERCKLEFNDYDTGEELDGQPLGAYSHRRIRLTFRPKDIGEFSYDLQLENANDSFNMEEVRFRAFVRRVGGEESLVVGSGGVLDFGDVCGGSIGRQKIVLKNVGTTPLEISFSSSGGEEVGFGLRMESGNHTNRGLRDHHHYSMTQNQLQLLQHQHHQQQQSRGLEDGNYSTVSSEVSSRASSPLLKGSGTLESGMSVSSSTSSLEPTNGFELLGGAPGTPAGGLDEPQGPILGGLEGEEITPIEELALRPGMERVVEVWWKPEQDTNTTDYRAGKLAKRTFPIILTYSSPGNVAKERKTIQCKAKTCTSLIEVSPKVVNFGDTDVGTLKSAPVAITNWSDMEAKVELRFVSKVLNCYRNVLTIPPKQTIEVKIDIYPRKVNPDYRKQITVVNLLNRHNDQLVEVRSTNIDKHRVTFHSLFYRILTPTSTNFLDFGALVMNSPAVRIFTVDNISKKRLVLELSSSLPNEIKIYGRGVMSTSTTNIPTRGVPMARKERLLETISDRRILKRSATDAAVTGPPIPIPISKTVIDTDRSMAGGRTEYLDLAGLTPQSSSGRKSPGRRRKGTGSKLKGFLDMTTTGDKSVGEVKSELGSRESIATGGDVHSIFAAKVGEKLKAYGKEKEIQGSGSLASIAGASGSTSGTIQGHGATTSYSGDMGAELSKMSFETLLGFLEKATGTVPPLFPKPALEERYVKAQMVLRRELESLIRDQKIVPVSHIDIPPQSERLVIVIFTPSSENKSHIQGKPRKQDGRIFLRLSEFDREIQQPQFETLLKADLSQIPVRELMIRSSLCRSVMELSQKNINFGLMDKNERRMKSILIRNRSEAPLLYSIRKSGSIASGDIIFGEGRSGVIRGYGKREVEFVFDPSLAGVFHEKLDIENVLDADNKQVLSVKANIRKPSNFFIQSLFLNFGVCLIGEVSPNIRHIVISNTSTKTIRTFEIRFENADMNFDGCIGELTFELLDESNTPFDSDNDKSKITELDESVSGIDVNELKRIRRIRPTVLLSKEAEEKLEHLEQKLKIAIRKGRKDKVKKIMEKIEILKTGGEPLKDFQKDDEEEIAPLPSSTSIPFSGPVLTPLLASTTPIPSPVSVIHDDTQITNNLASRNSFGIVKPPSSTNLSIHSDGSVTSPRSSVTMSMTSAISLEPQTSFAALPPLAQSTPNITSFANSTAITTTTPSIGSDKVTSSGGTNSRVRKTENSIIFSLEPRGIKTVAVYFKPVLRQFKDGKSRIGGSTTTSGGIGGKLGVKDDTSGSDTIDTPVSTTYGSSGLDENIFPMTASSQLFSPASSTTTAQTSMDKSGYPFSPSQNPEPIHGKVIVHEHKNMDVMKKVEFTALVCYDHPTYLQCLAEENETQRSTTNESQRKEDRIESAPEGLGLVLNSTNNNICNNIEPAGKGIISASDTGLIEKSSIPGAYPSLTSSQTHPRIPSTGHSTPISIENPMSSSLPVGTTVMSTASGTVSTTSVLAKGISNLSLSTPIADSTPLAKPLDEVTTETSSLSPLRPYQLAAELTSIDLGKITIRERKDCYFTLINKSGNPLQYEIVIPGDTSPFHFESLSGSLQGKQTKRIDLYILPLTTGRRSESFIVRDINTKQDLVITFFFYVVLASYLRFPLVSALDSSPAGGDLDLGYCYVDPSKKYAKIIPFVVENIAGEDLFITSVSNLALQCFIFSDPSTETPVSETLLPKGQSMVVYIALQPILRQPTQGDKREKSLPSSVSPSAGVTTGNVSGTGGNSSSNVGGGGGISSGTTIPSGISSALTSISSTGTIISGNPTISTTSSNSFIESRNLIGGIKFLVFVRDSSETGIPLCGRTSVSSLPSNIASPSSAPSAIPLTEGLFLTVTHTVKFTSIIGQSLLSVSDTVFDFGFTKDLSQTYTGTFYITNVTARLPLEYRIESLGSEIVVDKSSGKIDGLDPSLGSGVGTSNPEKLEKNTTTPKDKINFTLTPVKFGYLNRTLRVVNVNNSSQIVDLDIRLFVDPGLFLIKPQKSLTSVSRRSSVLANRTDSLNESSILSMK